MQSSGHVLFKEIKALKPEKSLEMAQVLFLETRLLFSILNIVQVLSAFWNEITGLSRISTDFQELFRHGFFFCLRTFQYFQGPWER